MIVVQDFADQLSAPKTKEVLSAMERWGIEPDQKVLMITAEKNEVVYRSVRNVANIKLILATNLNAYDIVLADRLVVTAAALEKIQEVYSA
jgi:large subunit ribosomal protein L4